MSATLPLPLHADHYDLRGPVSRAEVEAHFAAGLPEDVLAGARLADGRLLLEFPESFVVYPADPQAMRRWCLAESARETRRAADAAPVRRAA